MKITQRFAQLALLCGLTACAAPDLRDDHYAAPFAQLLASYRQPAEDWVLDPYLLIDSQRAILRAHGVPAEAKAEPQLRGRVGRELPLGMFTSLKRLVQAGLMHRLRLPEPSAEALAATVERQAVEIAGLDPATYFRQTGQQPVAEPLHLARVRAALEHADRLTAGRIDTSYDIPYVAGYDKRDGTRIYIDRSVPLEKVLPGSSVPVPIGRLLTIHELVEKAMIDEYGLRYQQAHQLALRMEREAATALEVSWESYDRYMVGVIDAVGQRRPERVPPGLDMAPYDAYSDPEGVAIREAMLRAMRNP